MQAISSSRLSVVVLAHRNNKGVVSDWRIILAWPLLMLVDLLLRTPPIARALFDSLAQ